MRRPTPTRHGSAMVIAAILVFILGSLAISLTETTVSNLQGEYRRTDDLAIAMASESAANIALDHLQHNIDLLKTDLSPELRKAQLPTMADVDAGTENADITGKMGVDRVHGLDIGARWCYVGQRAVTKTYVDGLPRLEVVALGTPDSMTQDVYFIRAWATRGGASDISTWRTKRVELLFVPYPDEVFVRAMFAHRGYDFQGDAKTDSWDSSTGPYDPSVPGSHGDLGSEGDIYVQKPGNVNGTIDDFINFPLPLVEYDSSLPLESPDILASSITLEAGTYHYAAINLQEPVQLTLNGAVTIYVDGPIAISGGKKFNPLIYATPTAKLTIIQNEYDADAHPEWSGINNSLDTVNGTETIGDPAKPGNLVIISAYTGAMTLNGNGVFGGVLYMPNATLKLNGTFDFYGSVIAEAFASKVLSADDEQGKINGTFSFHYDEQLSKLELPLPARIGVVGWFTSNAVVGGP